MNISYMCMTFMTFTDFVIDFNALRYVKFLDRLVFDMFDQLMWVWSFAPPQAVIQSIIILSLNNP
jgi:hypothetical protein